MKNTIKLLGIIALVAVIRFAVTATFAACGGDDGPSTPGGNTPGGGGNPQIATYTSTAGGTAYTLKITENTARYAAQIGDTFELTVGGKTSRGTVTNVSSGGQLTLKPDNSSTTFTAIVSGDGIASITGTITFTDGSTSAAPGSFTGGDNTPGGNTPSGNGTFTLTGIPSQYNGKWVHLEAANNSVELLGAQSVNSSTVTAALISGGSVSIPIWQVSGSTVTRYSGNHTVEAAVAIWNRVTLGYGDDDGDPIAARYYSSVTFSSGSATRDWSAGTDIGGSNPDPGTGGTFTVTGIPAGYNGNWALLEADIRGGGGIGSSEKTPISGGSVSIPLRVYSSATGNSTGYSGNDTANEVHVWIYNGLDNRADIVGSRFFESVTFSNGSAYGGGRFVAVAKGQIAYSVYIFVVTHINQQPRSRAAGLLFLKGIGLGFNTFKTAPRGGVLNPRHE